MSHFSKKINFIGSNKQEILVFLGNLVNLMDLRCVVIDCSLEQNLQYVIPVVINDDIITYRGVDYMINITTQEKYNNLLLDMYDVLIVDYGFNTEFAPTIQARDYTIMVTDFMKYNVEKLRFILQYIEKDVPLIKVYKDIVSSKISAKLIDRIIKVKELNIVEAYAFYLEEESYNYNLNMQYNDVPNFRHLKKEYADFLEDLLGGIFDMKEASIKKIIKNAKRRKKNASCILEYGTWAVSNNN